LDEQNTLIQQPGLGEAAAGDNHVDSRPEADEAKAIYAESSDELLVIPRVVFNYGVIAVTFFLLGVFIGAFAVGRMADANRAENQALIDQVVAAVSESAVGSTTGRQTAPDPNVRYEVNADDDPFVGPEDAPITIVEFADFKCSYCARFHNETVQTIFEDYEGQVRLIFRDYPILGATSLEAAYASECADSQGVFWPYHDLLYENQQILDRDAFIAFAEELELDVDAFTTCLDDETYRDEVFADYTDGQNLGVTGTPTFYINGRPIVGAQPYTVFASAINAELNALAGEQPAS
jgi:protein-disulfide isomerase